ncbi:hypothetical protein WA588_000502 [Blastocystis sp. NMH]
MSEGQQSIKNEADEVNESATDHQRHRTLFLTRERSVIRTAFMTSLYGEYTYETVLTLANNDGRKAEIREHLKRMFWSAFKRNNSFGFNMELVQSLVAKDVDCYLAWLKLMFPNLDYDNTKASKYAQTLKDYLQRLCKKAPLSSVLSLFPDTLPISVLTVRPVDDADSGSSPIDEWMDDVYKLSKASESVYRRLKELKILFKGDPAKPKDKELDGRIEENLASVFQMKDMFSSLEPRKKRLWNDLLAEMANDRNKRNRRRVATQAIERHDVEAITQSDVILDKEATYQDVVNPDQEVISQESSSVDQDMSSQDTETDD